MSYTAIASRVIQTEMQGLQYILDNNIKDFDMVVEQLLNCRGRVIVSGMGKSGHIGKKISATFASTGTPAIFVHPSEASHGDLGMIENDDVVLLLSNSGETTELKDIIYYVKRNNIKSIAITKNANSTLAKNCDLLLQLPQTNEACPLGLAPTTSTTATLVLGDCLAVCLLEAKNFSRNDFGNFHPGGKLGSRLLKAVDIMISGDSLPLVNTGTKLIDALREMEQKRVGCVGVMAGNKLNGIFTDGDLLRNLTNDITEKNINEVMTKNPIVVNVDTLGGEILAIMQEKNISAVFVIENDQIKGLVHFHDLLKAGVA